jgi:hypothetical protein
MKHQMALGNNGQKAPRRWAHITHQHPPQAYVVDLIKLLWGPQFESTSYVSKETMITI